MIKFYLDTESLTASKFFHLDYKFLDKVSLLTCVI